MKKTKAKKFAIIFVLLVILLSGTAIIQASVIDNPTIIEFEDEVLYELVKLDLTTAKINIQLNKDDETIPELGIKLSESDLEQKVSLNLQGTEGKKITNLKGIEYFTNLQDLNLTGNSIKEMETLVQLTNLKKLNMSSNDLSTQYTDSDTDVLSIVGKLTSLQELDMSNTKMTNVDDFSGLTNLQTLILKGNSISEMTPVSGLTNITTLDISSNRSFSTIGQIVSLEGLKELNISNTGITTLSGIEYMPQLEKLYASNITGLQKPDSDGDRAAALYKVDSTTKEPYLKNLKVLDLSNSGITETKDEAGNILQKANQVSVNFKSLSIITTLEELYLENMGISSLNGIVNLASLKILDLANNKLDSTDLNALIKESNEVVETENVLKASKIELQDNEIIDISIFSKYPGDIQYVDLSRNHIYDTEPLKKHSLSEKVYLQGQEILFSIYDKKVDVDHYIILPEIFQSNKIQDSIVYSESDFTLTGLHLNPDYTQPGDYNVIIGATMTKDDIISIKINGGNADGTILTYKIGESASKSHNAYVTESLFFNDANLYEAMYKEITTNPDYQKDIRNSLKVLPQQIININRQVIDKITLLRFCKYVN